MVNPNSYILVSDDHDNSSYISNAFTLLKLPLQRVTSTDFIEHPDYLNHAIAVMVCMKTSADLLQKLNEIIVQHAQTLPFLIFRDKMTKCQYTDNSAFLLNMPFSIFELKDALSHITNHQNKLIEPADFNNPIFEKLVGKRAAVALARTDDRLATGRVQKLSPRRLKKSVSHPC
ncbi:MAG: hypothetical protein ABL857_08120 [Rickettsiales bacterium]